MLNLDRFAGNRVIVESVIPNGRFTLEFSDGSHKTFRIKTKRLGAKFAPGQRVLGLLVGPDNTDDYEDFAWVNEDGFKVWNGRTNKLKEYATLLWRLIAGEAVDGVTLLIEKRCLVCGRALTTPEAVERGVGSECWERYGRR